MSEQNHAKLVELAKLLKLPILAGYKKYISQEADFTDNLLQLLGLPPTRFIPFCALSEAKDGYKYEAQGTRIFFDLISLPTKAKYAPFRVENPGLTVVAGISRMFNILIGFSVFLPCYD